MVSILNSKKGAISGVLASISTGIQTIVNILPAPVKALLFIFLITTIVSIVVPAFLQGYGYTCVSEDNAVHLYQVPLQNFPSKIVMDFKETTRDFFGLDAFDVEDVDFLNNDKNYYIIPEQCIIQINNGTHELRGYSAFCSDCPFAVEPLFLGENFVTIPLRIDQSVCIASGNYSKTIWNGIGVYERNFCYMCSPPNPYYYNHTNFLELGRVFTLLPEYSVDDVVDDFNQKRITVLKLGGVRRTQSNEEIVNVQCTEDEVPKLFFFSLDLFDRTMWILLFVGYALITFAWGYYNHVL